MKARFLALAALVLGLASCQNDFDGVRQNAKGEVDFRLSVAAPDLGTTRAGENGQADEQNAFDSAFGAIDYLQGAVTGDQLRADWGDVDLRYTLEVYDVTADYTDAVPVKDRMVIIKDSYEAVTFELRLVPNRDYHFVVFADFVEDGLWQETDLNQGVDFQANLGKHHIIGETLADITIKEDGINDECSDAYFATKDIKISNAAPQEIVLKRPYGKLRVIATDLAELNLNVEPKTVKVAYSAKHPQTFNALTGEIGATEDYTEYSFEFESLYNEGVGKQSLANHFYVAGYDDFAQYGMTNDNGESRHTHMTLFTDYILAKDDHQTAYHFEMEVYDTKGELIKATEFATDIPVQRNFLTTVIGNVLTTATDIEVRIDDNFAGYHYFNLWDGEAVAEPKKNAEGIYEIYEASELAWLAAQVNGGTRAAGISFKGETFRLMKDIHLNDERWTAIGAPGCPFSGTFDGNGFKIEGLFVSETGKASAGLFGYCPSATIKNLTVLNAEVYGNFKAAVIVADAVCTKIENCHVNDAIVLSTPYNQNDGNNVGAIAGYLAADGGTAWVKNCTVKNAQITAYRKVGGIVGAANLASEVTDNYIESSYITADMTAEYKTDEKAYAGRIIGYKHANAKDENNTYAGQTTETVANALAVRVIVMPKADKIADYVNDSEEFIVMLPGGDYSFTADVEENKTLQANGVNVTLNVYEHNLKLGDASNYGVIASNGAEVVVNDANIVSGGGGYAASGGSKVTVNGGSAHIDSSSTSGRYVFYAVGEGSVITVNGGSYSWDPADNQKRAYVYTVAGAKVIINDGTFGKASSRSDYKAGILGSGETIIYGGTFGFNPTKWVAPGCTVTKDGANWVVKAPVVVEDAAGLADAVANATEGSTIVLSENVNYGAITAAELKNVTIEGAEGAVMIFKTTADSKIENVTLKNVNFEYTGATADCGIVIDANAQINNLVAEGCTFTGTGAKAGRGISGLNNNASIELNNCSFKDLGYPIYAWGGYASLKINGCTFDNIKSWAIMPQSGFDGDLTVTGNTFKNCLGGGLIKAGTLTAGHTFTFTDNVITNCTIAGDHNWFQFNVSAGTVVLSGNTKDGIAWTPGTAEGLK